MILHLERKFTSPTETFIVNQINAANYFKHLVFTINHFDNLTANATIYYPDGNKSIWDFRRLKLKHLSFFKKQFLTTSPLLIHSHFLTDARFFHVFTKNISVPKICSCYGYDISKIPNKYGLLARLYFRKTFQEYNLFLAMTEDMKRDLIRLGCPEEKILVHYYGTDISSFTLNRDYEISDKLILLTIGSLVPKKGHITVLKAIKKLKEEFPNLIFEYNIVGSGPLENMLREFVKLNLLEGQVNFKGSLPHGEKFNEELKRAHVFIHPSITPKSGDKEGIPGTIVEAMASGLPVISTYHAGIPYIIENGKNGYLVPENDFYKIKQLILVLSQKAELRKQIGQNAKDFANKNLDLTARSKELESLYKLLINQHSSQVS